MSGGSLRAGAPGRDDRPPRPMTGAELKAIIRLVHDTCGIALHDGKRALIAARLGRRLKACGAASYSEYLRVVEQDASGREIRALVDAITTNHTSFFREPQHFDFLRQSVLPEWVARQERRPLAVWCAACSTGEEPYTIAMTLFDALPAEPAPGFHILASDISTRVLKVAADAVYPVERVSNIPTQLLRRHFERGVGEQQGLARARAHLRGVVEFRQLNLLEIIDLKQRFDVIFCRNVMIYFDTAVQQKVVRMLERHLAPGGHLFFSHSESLSSISHGMAWRAPAVYRRGAA